MENLDKLHVDRHKKKVAARKAKIAFERCSGAVDEAIMALRARRAELAAIRSAYRQLPSGKPLPRDAVEKFEAFAAGNRPH